MGADHPAPLESHPALHANHLAQSAETQRASRDQIEGGRSVVNHGTVILVPIKSFAWAKTRLRAILSDAARSHLAQALALNALSSLATQADTFAVADDEEVISFVRSAGHRAIIAKSRGLNGGLRSALDAARSNHYANVLIVHSDIPLIGSVELHLTALSEGRAVITPDRHSEGTNLLGFPLNRPPALHYGQQSAPRHLRSLASLQLDISVIINQALAFDLDTPLDLVELRAKFDQQIPLDIQESLSQATHTVSATSSHEPSSTKVGKSLTNVNGATQQTTSSPTVDH